MNSETSDCILRYKSWACAQPSLRRVWLYGSCALGSETPDSDIDVAFEIDPLLDDSAKSMFRTEIYPRWHAEIQLISHLKLHLEPWTVVKDYVATSGIVIYERAV